MRLYKTAALLCLSICMGGAAWAESTEAVIERGRYLVKVGGCNDCHTAGYWNSGGKLPESEWLTGDILGWHGPWGTTYSTNLRLYMSAISESEWISIARTMKTRPPMPWYTINEMKESDLKAIYRYIRSLGAAGRKVPDYLAPGEGPPNAPVIKFPLAMSGGK